MPLCLRWKLIKICWGVTAWQPVALLLCEHFRPVRWCCDGGAKETCIDPCRPAQNGAGYTRHLHSDDHVAGCCSSIKGRVACAQRSAIYAKHKQNSTGLTALLHPFCQECAAGCPKLIKLHYYCSNLITPIDACVTHLLPDKEITPAAVDEI